jgi:hypothetical protein
LAELLKNSGRKNFLDDVRLARMLEFFIYVHSPVDPDFGMRIVPPVGDHGLSLSGPSKRFGEHLRLFTQSDNPGIKDIVARAAWLVQEDGGSVPNGVQPVKPEMDSRWLRGYGTVMRAAREADQTESFLVLRAGQSWGHHHQDKGSMWFWGRNVHFFGDAAWGAPPGGTYWNEYKQGPASGTQIEFVGVNNWTLPCKYPAPWISDDEYTRDFDYAHACCLYPFNPDLDLSKSSPVAFENGYNRQVLFVKPDVLIVRDNVESMCDTIWRMHSYQVDGLKVRPGGAEMASPHGVTGQLRFVYPPDVTLQRIDRDDLNDHAYRGADGKSTPYDQRPFFGAKKGEKGQKGRASSFDSRSVVLKWNMPKNHSATWVFGVHGQNEAAPLVTSVDDLGRVTKVKLDDGTEIIALLNIDPFEYQANGVQFTGTAGLILKKQGRVSPHLIRGKKLTLDR